MKLVPGDQVVPFSTVDLDGHRVYWSSSVATLCS